MKEELSAFMDGELSSKEVGLLLSALGKDPTLLDDWSCWQEVRNALRKRPSIASPAFMHNFSTRLQKEPVVTVSPEKPTKKPHKKLNWSQFLVPIALTASFSFIAFKLLHHCKKQNLTTSDPIHDTHSRACSLGLQEQLEKAAPGQKNHLCKLKTRDNKSRNSRI